MRWFKSCLWQIRWWWCILRVSFELWAPDGWYKNHQLGAICCAKAIFYKSFDIEWQWVIITSPQIESRGLVIERYKSLCGLRQLMCTLCPVKLLCDECMNRLDCWNAFHLSPRHRHHFQMTVNLLIIGQYPTVRKSFDRGDDPCGDVE